MQRSLCVIGLAVLVGICLTSAREIPRSRREAGEVGDLEVAASGHGKHWKKGGGKEHHSDHHASHGEKGDKGYKVLNQDTN